MKAIQSSGYTIFFEDGLSELQNFLSKNSYSKVFILVDSNTEKYCLPIVQDTLAGIVDFDVVEIDPGEENKNIDFCIGIWKTLLDFGADRNSLLINLGGGVVTDMGSFAASTFKRGIDFAQMPTTLLAQVDASVGGKTGIDLDHIKNIIGTFAQPKAIFIVPEFLQTLDHQQLRSGFAEIIKHGLIYDEAFFRQIQSLQPHQVTPEIVQHSVEIKNEIVKADPFENGLRKIVNFGHTIGHAIESYSLANDPIPLLHGEAIAIGFICEGYLSMQKNELSKNDLLEIERIILSLYPKYDLKESSFPALIAFMKNDKKNNSDRINCSLLRKIGQCSIDNYCSEEDIQKSLMHYLSIK
jgi:3-dehydroquinate synthase